jgi:nucleotide-binding universal stress UspA family protein
MPRDTPASATADIRTIIVPHDFSNAAEGALRYALDLAEKLRAKVTVLHVYDVTPFTLPEGPAITAEVVKQMEMAAKEGLDRVLAGARRPGLELRAVLIQGIPWCEIDNLAVQEHADLIVMGTHGRRGFTRALLGSVTEKVVRSAPCPVLTVRSVPRAEAAAQP